MKAQVIWTDEAVNDLETIYDFLAENSQLAAQRIVESILNRVKQSCEPRAMSYELPATSQLSS
jgi:plasmid stabilization system protein ParE